MAKYTVYIKVLIRHCSDFRVSGRSLAAGRLSGASHRRLTGPPTMERKWRTGYALM
jgi:hypothetical protein